MAANSDLYPSHVPATPQLRAAEARASRLGFQLLLSAAALSNRPLGVASTVIRLPERRSDTPPLLDPAS